MKASENIAARSCGSDGSIGRRRYMISANRDRVTLDGSDKVIQKEIAYLIGTFRSRMLSQGKGSQQAAKVINDAVTASEQQTLSDLRSEVGMAIEFGQ